MPAAQQLIEFTKMHGLGNDFVVIDNRNQHFPATEKQIRKIADRHTGVGCDQLLLVESAQSPENDFKYRIFNADGAEVEQCGNGARCFARYVHERGLTEKTCIRVETRSGIISLYLEPDKQVRVNMGKPDFSARAVHIQSHPDLTPLSAHTYSFKLNGRIVELMPVSMGNPHVSLILPETEPQALQQFDLQTLGEQLNQHPAFPQGINVGIMQIIDENNIRLRVYERGVGETLACGSGACAAVANGIEHGILNQPVRVQLRLGDLMISWQGMGHPLWMSGPASFVFEGQMQL